ncbi:MAG: hypothetical protein ACRDZX_01880 [Acidimicrobiales bacterium]
MSAQHGELVAEDQDLGVLGTGVHPVNTHNLEDTTDQTVQEAERHGWEPR